MRKNFIKFKVSKAFQSCRPKDPSATALPPKPHPSLHHKLTHPPPPSQQQQHHRNCSSLTRHVSSAFLSARRTILGSSSSSRSFHEDPHTGSSPSSPTISSSRIFQWKKNPKWHVIAKIPDPQNYNSTPPRRKIYTSSASDNENNNHHSQNDVVVFPPLDLPVKKTRRRRRNRTTKRAPRRSFQKVRLSTTSSDSGLFSEDDDEVEERENDHETDTLVSTDECGSSTPKRISNARVSVFMRRMVRPCRAVEGKVRESFAVVKKSEDPYEDFRRSMAEMVVEKQMFEAKELEELLRCFLSLNSVHHHEVIVRAFADIWEALFSQSSNNVNS